MPSGLWQPHRWELTKLEAHKTDQTDSHYANVALPPDYPEDPSVYCATFEGLYVSTDLGENWVERNVNPTRIGRRLRLSPTFEKDGTVVANTYGTPVMVSTNRGDDWKIRNTNFGALVVQPRDLSRVRHRPSDRKLFTPCLRPPNRDNPDEPGIYASVNKQGPG